MPIPKRWFPKSRDFNDDPEGWELTDTFGDRTVRLWDEICAILDKTENHWLLTAEALIAVARKVRMSPGSVFLALDWMVQRRWVSVSSDDRELLVSRWSALRERLVSSSSAAREGPVKGSSALRELLVSRSSAVVSSPKYWKYHKSQETKGESLSPDQGPYKVPSYPNLSEPSLPILKDPPLTPPKDPPSAAPTAAVLKKQLDPGIKAVADRIYRSDKVKYARLIGWIKTTQQTYSDDVIAETLIEFEPFSKDIQNWYPYLSKIAMRIHNTRSIEGAAKQSNLYKHQNMEGIGSIMAKMAAKGPP